MRVRRGSLAEVAVPEQCLHLKQKGARMSPPESIEAYLRRFSGELGERILASYPALHDVNDPVSPRIKSLLRKPFAAQTLAIMGVVRRWEQARTAAVVAECGTGKTLISLAAVHVHSAGKPFTAIAMVPPHLTEKWAREALLTIPGLRVFMVDALRNSRAGSKAPSGVSEVKWKHGHIIRQGLHTTLTDLRLRKHHRSARARWQQSICPGSSLFVVGRDRAKLGYFWRHAYQVARSGPHVGCVVNPDTGVPVFTAEDQLRRTDFRKARLSEVVDGKYDGKAQSAPRKPLYSPLWQADESRIRRVAPLDFIGRYMPHWFDYAICDEAHQLAGDTAQGNGLGTLATCADRVAILTGTLLGGYADDLYNILFRLEPHEMIEQGYEWGQAGLRSFAETYGVLERITTIEPADNECSRARVSRRIKRKPGASPLLFGQYLMGLGAFVSLEDISNELPPYREEVIGVPMDEALGSAYRKLEEDVRSAIRAHRGNQSVLSAGLNALLLYPDRPFGLGELTGYEYDPETETRQKFVIAETQDLDTAVVQAKERRLLSEIKMELSRGNRCHVYAVYTRKRDVTRRLERILAQEGIQVAILTSDVATDKREAWFAKRIREGVQVTICHPKIIETGIDLISHTCLIFYQTGYCLHTLRQAGRRSWRIGQRRPVRVIYLHYEDTMQSACLRLMGKKLLVSLAMEGKFTTEGLQSMEADDDMLTAMARELVTEQRLGESADAVWRQIQSQRGEVCDSAPVPPSGPSNAPDVAIPARPTLVTRPPRVDLVTADQSLDPADRRRRRTPDASVPVQLPLFGS